MKASHFLSALLFTSLAAPRLARADQITDHADAVRHPAEDKDWGNCLLNYRMVRRNREFPVGDDTKVAPLEKAVGSLAVGATPTVKELEALCLAQAKADPGADHFWHGQLSLRVEGFRSYIAEVQTGAQTFNTMNDQISDCYDIVDYAGQVLGPTTALKYDGGNGLPAWSGTIADAKQICDSGQKVADAAKAKLLEPYVKAGMKNDKLQMISDNNGGELFNIPGGESTLDPKKLTKANAWFDGSEGDSCAHGTIWHMTRYQFDKDQKLVKTTNKEFCGDVPKSYYK